MSDKIRSIRGMKDILPIEASKWQYLERVMGEIAESYGYGEIRVPTMEKTPLFIRSVGDTTDVVQKEMYTFEMGRESITLRPEGTAGTVRALLQNGMLNDAYPVKLYYILTCFRHENPQAGRYREFNQFGIECFGAESPLQDAEIIALVNDLLEVLGIDDIVLNINSIGCKKCRPSYNKALVDYYTAHEASLCDNCKDRLDRNPLRLLDCKEEGCQPLKEAAPKSIDYLCEECDSHFAGFKSALDSLGIKYTINPYIVRGLDYYTKTVFEFITNQIGAQGTVCAGGRYDGLIEEMGGPATAGIGFGMGIERLLMVMEAAGSEFPPPPAYALYIGSMGAKEGEVGLKIATDLRSEGFYVLCDTMGRSVKAQMKYADKKEVGYSCIIGSNELKEGKMKIREMATGKETEVEINSEAVGTFLWDNLQADILGHDHDHENILNDLLGGE